MKTQTIDKNSLSFKLGYACGLLRYGPPQLWRILAGLASYTWAWLRLKRKVNQGNQREGLN